MHGPDLVLQVSASPSVKWGTSTYLPTAYSPELWEDRTDHRPDSIPRKVL